jgi:hypothetical protein
MIILSKTFSETTPESAEHGDFSNSGFEWQDVEYTFKELIDELKNNNYCIHQLDRTISNDFETVCYRTMTERQFSLHYSRDNNERSVKYWKKALEYVSGKYLK